MNDSQLAGANIGVLLISNVAWGSCIFECDTLKIVRPMQLAFPAYDDDALTKVIGSCLQLLCAMPRPQHASCMKHKRTIRFVLRMPAEQV